MLYRAFSFAYCARQLKQARKLRKLTQAQLATSSGVRQATISKLEKQTSCDVSLVTLERLAAALHANLRVDFTLAETPSVKPQPTPFEAKQLSDWEYERLEEIGRRFDAAHAAKQEAKEEPNPWAGRYTKTVEYGEDGTSYVEEFHFDQTDEELMEAFQRGELT